MSRLRELVEAYKNKDLDRKTAEEAAIKKMEELVEEKRFRVEDVFSLREAFNILVNPENDVNLESDEAIREAISYSSFPHFTGAMVSKVLINEYEQELEDVGKLVYEVKSSSKNEDICGTTVHDDLKRREPGLPYEEGYLGEKYITVQNDDYGIIFGVEAELVLFDKTAQLLRRVSGLGYKAGIHRHRFIIECLQDVTCNARGDNRNFVFGGTRYGVYQTNHTTIPGEPYANPNTIAGGLTYANLDLANSLLKEMRDVKGNYCNITPLYLVVHPRMKVAAARLVNSTWYPVANRFEEYNLLKGFVTIVESPWIQSTGTCYIGRMDKQMVWTWVEKPSVSVQKTGDHEFERRIIARYRLNYYGGIAHTDYRWIVRITS